MPDTATSTFSGRTALVTGATSGIGFETARQLAEQGCTVIVHAPSGAAGQDAIARLTAAGTDAARLSLAVADFTRLEEVETMARSVREKHPRIDVLVNNAAIAAPERHTITADGNEIAFQVNFLAAYLLTRQLEKPLSAAPAGRVVNVSSSLHRTASISWSDPNRARRYSRLAAYAQSQLALTVFAADSAVQAVSVHPGTCDTALLPLYGHEGAPAAEGAAHVVRLCDPATEIVNGAYYDRSEEKAPAPAATEERTIKRLNKLADQLVGADV